MKKTFLTFSILATVTGAAIAQVSKAVFSKDVNDLSGFFDAGTFLANQTVLHNLFGMMKAQMNYLQSDIDTKQAQVTRDSTIAATSGAKVSGSAGKERYSDNGSFTLAQRQAISSDKNNLSTEQGMYNEILSVTNHLGQSTADERKRIIRCMNRFADTLQ